MVAGATAPVAVVIVNRNGGAHLPRALEALAVQTLSPRRVIVVDNGSTDRSAELAERQFPDIEVMRLGENAGFAAANNRGVERAADCEWVALLNPDAFPEPGWLAALIEAAGQHPDAVAFGSRALIEGSSRLVDVDWLWLRRSWRVSMARHHWLDEEAGWPQEILAPSAVAAMYRRDVFLDAGGFDETFFCYFEDVDLALRLALAGHRARFVPNAEVSHVGSASSGRESEFAVYHSQRNMVWSFVKATPGPLFALYLPLHIATNLALVAWFTVRGRPGAVLRAKRDALRGLPAAWRARRAVQAARRIEPRQLDRMIRGGAPR